MQTNETTAWAGAMHGHINAHRPALTNMAYWRAAFLCQRRRYPWTCDGVRGVHPYQVARKAAMKPVALPADRKPAPVLHPVFAGMFQSMGLMERAA